jgi:hypothetical protein
VINFCFNSTIQLVQLTGNPFVDAGFGIVAARTGHESIQTVCREDLQKSVGSLTKVVGRLKDFKLLAAFWVNNPFMGKNLGQKEKFTSFLERLQAGSLPTRAGYCQACGGSPVLVHEADRCWFPLAGGRDSDPCTSPELQGKVVCPDCMAAVVILPLGCSLCADGPYFVHVTEPELQMQAVREGTDVLTAALASNTGSGIAHGTTLRGRAALLEIASGSLLWDQAQGGRFTAIPSSGATMISFSNSGNAACFNQLHLPAEALKFFSALREAGLGKTFLGWAQRIQKGGSALRPLLDELCGSVEGRRSVGPFLLALVRARKADRLHNEEYRLLQIYENVALGKKERFDTLQRLSTKIRQMPGRYSDSFIKQLGNLGSKKSLLDLFKEFCKRENTSLTITPREIRALAEGPPSETSSLLYLLCIAQEETTKE